MSRKVATGSPSLPKSETGAISRCGLLSPHLWVPRAHCHPIPGSHFIVTSCGRQCRVLAFYWITTHSKKYIFHHDLAYNTRTPCL